MRAVYAAGSIDECKDLTRAVTDVTHNHEEGLKGAEAIALAVYLARTGSSKEEIRMIIKDNYYPLELSGELKSAYNYYKYEWQRLYEKLKKRISFFDSDILEAKGMNIFMFFISLALSTHIISDCCGRLLFSDFYRFVFLVIFIPMGFTWYDANVIYKKLICMTN